MKKFALAAMAILGLQLSAQAQSEALTKYAEDAAKTYCTCEPLVKMTDITVDFVDGKISEAEANERSMALIAEVQNCTYPLALQAMNLSDAENVKAAEMTFKIIEKKYPDCGKKLAKAQSIQNR